MKDESPEKLVSDDKKDTVRTILGYKMVQYEMHNMMTIYNKTIYNFFKLQGVPHHIGSLLDLINDFRD